MAKQDVLDAINATIIENGQKGITAQSLNNVLTMMAENAGEGGGSSDGALRVIVPDMLHLGPEIVAMGELSLASWEEVKPIIEAEGIDVSEYDAIVKAAFEHNANVAQQIIAKAKAGQGVSVVLDQTPYCPAAINVSLQTEPEMAAFYEDLAMCVVQPAGLFAQYIKPTPEGGSMFGEDFFVCALAPTGNVYLDGMDATYPSNMLIILNLDGSLFFEKIEEEQPSSGSGVVTFYMLGGGVHQNDTTIAMNKKSYDAFWAYDGLPAVNILANIGESYTKNDGFEAMYPIVVAGAPNEGLILQTSEFQFEISSDGNMVFSDIPTA